MLNVAPSSELQPLNLWKHRQVFLEPPVLCCHCLDSVKAAAALNVQLVESTGSNVLLSFEFVSDKKCSKRENPNAVVWQRQSLSEFLIDGEQT